jgi:hypothetical protein
MRYGESAPVGEASWGGIGGQIGGVEICGGVERLAAIPMRFGARCEAGSKRLK